MMKKDKGVNKLLQKQNSYQWNISFTNIAKNLKFQCPKNDLIENQLY